MTSLRNEEKQTCMKKSGFIAQNIGLSISALYGPLHCWKLKKLMMAGKISKRHRKWAQFEPSILNRLEMAVSSSEDIKNRKSQKTLILLLDMSFSNCCNF